MTRETAIEAATRYFDTGGFADDLGRRVRIPTESADPSSLDLQLAYLGQEIIPQLQRLGCRSRIVDNPVQSWSPFLIAERQEDPAGPTVLVYGHGDVVLGHPELWRSDLEPFRMVVDGDRWYGRGTADNKGQHTINFAALEQVLAVRGRLGFNLKIILDMGEETGSPGLEEVCAELADELGADLLIGSDGCRVAADLPTVFLGSRGVINFSLHLSPYGNGYHSGNWGGLIANPGTRIANAVASLVDANGVLRIDGLRPPTIEESVRSALDGVTVDPGDGPAVDPNWGEPGLTPAERLYAWNTLEVLAFTAGSPEAPVNAIPASATAHCQLRFVVGTDEDHIEEILRRHLDANGFTDVGLTVGHRVRATRPDPHHPLVDWVADSIQRSAGVAPVRLPNLGGTLPNAAFARTLGLPTIWVPHSYPACGQHAADEHLLGSLARQGAAADDRTVLGPG
ncbi:M20 family metallopeptidase [Microlunatus sp. Gsoil 973]|uniref:M20 family metallopeptidase n=1 Tax=Microlunatus sp. Gsoil 973 TaxID=2672569 RepID=UPI001E541F23|nr:M20 family metallopeptidase [Microlunatus sp. Gsoil 973]